MPDYLYLFRGGDAAMSKMSPEQMQQHMAKWMGWIERLSQAGIYKAGEPLEKSGKVLRGKKAAVTDGPYAESKDLVGGYLIVKTATLSKATEIAKECPIFESDGSVEIREIKELHPVK
ncbi:MAG TPA: YciI family protein [Planctomycetota bacterium]|nr:YciI family protein [Planctomycetota bacterium]